MNAPTVMSLSEKGHSKLNELLNDGLMVKKMILRPSCKGSAPPQRKAIRQNVIGQDNK